MPLSTPLLGSAETVRTLPVIVIAEDNRLNRETLVDFLELSNFFAVPAYDGQHAIDQIASVNPDIVLMDINRPNLDGLDAIRQVRASGNSVPIIALTGKAMVGDASLCLTAGATDYITKPVRLEKLLRTIRHHLATKHHSHPLADPAG